MLGFSDCNTVNVGRSLLRREETLWEDDSEVDEDSSNLNSINDETETEEDDDAFGYHHPT